MRVKTDYIDLYQIHWPDRFVDKYYILWHCFLTDVKTRKKFIYQNLNRYLKMFSSSTVNINSDVHHFKLYGSYVPMFGETDYDPLRHYTPVGFEEQLDALKRAVDAGKVSHDSKDANFTNYFSS